MFDAVANADELDIVIAFQSLTNPRLRQEIGEISLVAEPERVFGPGSTPVMAAFTHLNRAGSRFSDGTWGVYYRAAGSWGFLYRSVRHPGAECVAILRPKAVQLPVVQGAHITLQWDGARLTGWYHKSDHRTLGKQQQASRRGL